MSPVAVTFPVNSLTEPAKFTTLALPAILIVTLALSATLTFDVPFGRTVGVTVVSNSSLKLSLHLIYAVRIPSPVPSLAVAPTLISCLAIGIL